MIWASALTSSLLLHQLCRGTLFCLAPNTRALKTSLRLVPKNKPGYDNYLKYSQVFMPIIISFCSVAKGTRWKLEGPAITADQEHSILK